MNTGIGSSELEARDLQRMLQDVTGNEPAELAVEYDGLNNNKVWRNTSAGKCPIDEVNGIVPEKVGLGDDYVHPWIAEVHNMLCDGLSPVVAFVGRERLGKSRAALVASNKLHAAGTCRGDFTPEEQTIYSTIPFLMFYMHNTRRVAMYDEANETVNKNDYNSLMNRAVAGAIRTQQIREIPNFFIGPELSEFDPRIRHKVDLVIELTGEQYAKVTRYEPKHGKKRVRGKDYIKRPLANWRVPDVDADLDAEYDAIDKETKQAYLESLLSGVLRRRMEELEEQDTAVV